jgi:hypothetical protein
VARRVQRGSGRVGTAPSREEAGSAGKGKNKMKGARSKIVTLAAALLAAAPGLAGAQGDRAGREGLFTPYGEYVLVGGGVTDFTESALKDSLDLGAAWDVRLGFGSRTYVGGEVGYVGSFRGGKQGASDVMTNGAEAVVRVQYPYTTQGWLIEPFAFGGIGWNRLSVLDAPAGVTDKDDVGVIPFGGGLTFGRGRLLLDARFTYRSAFAEDLPGPSGSALSLDQWAVNAAVGWEF